LIIRDLKRTTWADVPGAYGNIYLLANTSVSDSGKLFRMTATNALGSQTSNPAELVVNPNFNFDPTESTVGVFDVLSFMAYYGSTNPAHLALVDFNGDGVINDDDLIMLLNQF